ncbi:SRPBCC family protein [Kitasatospora sp. NBC_01302]|uniref:SRPBCC family protein n=1 Tax=Kitasatospora sp. NBC_01302 TaxID=2903575 RepID=UPI002E11A3F1|nr:SRPBCC family protein [Kitasatospora sp. NBC_01302]
MVSTTPPASPKPARLRSALLAIPLALAGLLGAAPAPAHAAAPAPLSCLGQGIDPAAQLHYQTEAFIKAPPSTVWRLHTDVTRWPAWQSAVTSMKRLDPGPLRSGSQFRWTTPAPATASTPATTLVITSTVQQIEPGRCIRWSGPAIGTGLSIDRGVHVWNFTRVRGGVLVRTEESWTGRQIDADPATAAKYLYPGLDAWLSDLKTAAEARSDRA